MGEEDFDILEEACTTTQKQTLPNMLRAASLANVQWFGNRLR